MSNSIAENLEIIKTLLLTHKSILNMDELSVLTGMSKSTIYKLTAGREIPHYKKDAGSKVVFFKRREIERWLTTYKVKTNDEVENESNKFLINKNRKR